MSQIDWQGLLGARLQQPTQAGAPAPLPNGAPETAGNPTTVSPTKLDLSSIRFASAPVQEAAPIQAAPVQAVPDNRGALEVGTDSLVRGALTIESNIRSAFGDFDGAARIQQDIARDYAARNVDITAPETSVAGFAGEAIGSNAVNLGVTLGLLAIPVVGWAAAGAYTFAQMYGESRQNIYDNTGKDNPMAALAPAAVNTALEMNPIAAIAKRYGIGSLFKGKAKEVVAEVKKSGLLEKAADSAAFAGKLGLKEGFVEVAQGASNLVTLRVLQDKAFSEYVEKDDVKAAINDFAGGFFAGAGIGATLEAGTNIYDNAKASIVRERLQREQDQANDLLDRIFGKPGRPLSESEVRAADGSIIDTAAALSIEQSRQLQEMAKIINTYPPNIQELVINGITARRDAVMGEIASIDAQLKAQSDSFTLTQNQQTTMDNNQFSRTWTDQRPPEPIEDILFRTVRQVSKNKVSSLKNGVTVVRDENNELVELPASAAQTPNSFFIPDTNIANIDEKTLARMEELNKAIRELINQTGADLNLHNNTTKKVTVMFYDKNRIHSPGTQGFITSQNGESILIALERNMPLEKAAVVMQHEIGHALFYNILSQHQQSGQLSKAFVQEWAKALTSVSTESQYYGKYWDGVSRSGVNSVRRINATDFKDSHYPTSSDEFAAELFSKAISSATYKGDLNLKQIDAPLYNKLVRKMRLLYRISKQDIFSSAHKVDVLKDHPTFETFVKRSILRKEQFNIETLLKSQTENKPTSEKPQVNGMLDMMVTMNVDPSIGKATANIVDLNVGFLGGSLFGRTIKKLMTPIQIAEQAGKRGFSLPTYYMGIVQSFQVTKMRIIERADRMMKALAYDKAATTRISRMLFLASQASDEHKRMLSEQEIEKLASELGLTQTDLNIWREADNSLRDIITELERTQILDLMRNPNKSIEQLKAFRDAFMAAKTVEEKHALFTEYTGEKVFNLEPGQPLQNPLYKSLTAIQAKAAKLRNRNYFPRSRTGKYFVRLTAKEADTTWEGYTAAKEGDTVGFYTFDTEADQMEFLKEVNLEDADSGSIRAVAGTVSPSIYSSLGMPSVLLDKVKNDLEEAAKERGETLSKEDRRVLNDLMLELTPGRRFLKHMTKRRGIAGYSEDVARVYSTYMSNAASHVARAEHAADMAATLSKMDKLIENYPGDKIAANDLISLNDYFKDHFKYIMSNENDWANVRAAGFLWYLGFNVKSAAVNFMQTPLILYPVLAGHTSDAHAVKRISGAMVDAGKFMKNPDSLEPSLLNTIDQVIKAGLIDESMVSDLAGFGEESVLRRSVAGYDLKTVYQKFAYYGGTMFRFGEKYNRLVATIAAHRIAKDKGLPDDQIFEFVRDIIQGSQFEYSRFNRATFMRGKKSIVFLFWQYMQHASYLFAGGKGAVTARRMWLIALAVGGIEGLPFMEFLLDMLDWGGTQMKRMLGYSNPRVDIRHDIRTLLTEMQDFASPDAFLKGGSYFYGLGPLHALSLIGAPIPNISTRGSLSYGDPVPWFDGITDPTISDDQKLVYKTVAGIGGPVGGIFLSGLDAMMSKDPVSWKTFEKVMPTFARNASTGIRWLAEGEEKGQSQSKLLSFTTPEERAEAVLKSLGFQPTRVDQTRQQMRAFQVASMYMQSRRNMLLNAFSMAHANDNREAIADARKAIEEYNNEVLKSKTLAPLYIGGKTMARSVKAKLVNKAYLEANILGSPDEIFLQEEIQKLYPINKD